MRFVSLLLLASCGFITEADRETRQDADGDGYASTQFGGQDCDDTDPDRNPESIWFADADGDGFGDLGSTTVVCEMPEGHAANPDDCDDTDPFVYPGAPERCDGVRNSCDGGSVSDSELDGDGDGFVPCLDWQGDDSLQGGDCDDTNVERNPDAVWYRDADGDNYGSSSPVRRSCVQPPKTAANSDDCNDTDARVFPGAPQLCDGTNNDCDSPLWPVLVPKETDFDDDGWVACDPFVGMLPAGLAGGGDCDDFDASTYPGAPEACDGVASDCDATGWPLPPDDERDLDSDGYVVCEGWTGDVSLQSGDCDGTRSTVFPGAPEVCDGENNSCGATIPADEADVDGDGFVLCSPFVGTLPGLQGGDCDDADETTFPGAPDLCDGKANDCQMDWPNPRSAETDDDSDGFVECDPYIGADPLLGGDCDDADPDEFPGQTWHPDVDGDGFGDGSVVTACEQPSDHAPNDLDCDDGDPDEKPGQTWYLDADDDDFGDTASSVVQCLRPLDHVTDPNDCDDDDDQVFPGATGVHTVDGGVVQSAITAAVPGDLICVFPGTYVENLDFLGKDVELVAPLGPGLTTLDGNGAGPVITLASGESAAAVVQGFTIQNGLADNGGGVMASGGAATFVDLVVVDNEANVGGGGIELLSFDSVVMDVVLEDNVAGPLGGAGLLSLAGAQDLDRVVAIGNTGGIGAGIRLHGSGTVATDLVVHGNTAIDIGGGIAIGNPGPVTLSHIDVRDNEVQLGDAGGIDVNGPLFLSNAVIVGNTAADDGGGINLQGASLLLTNATVHGNAAADAGGGIHLDVTSPTFLSLTNVSITGNTGGGLHVQSDAPQVFASNISQNTPTDVTGMTDPMGTNDNISVAPAYVDVSSADPLAWNLWLGPGSALIDAGDILIEDPDCSRSDIGAYGGPAADFSWYEDNPGDYTLQTCP